MAFQGFKPSKLVLLFVSIIIVLLAKDFVGLQLTRNSSGIAYPMMEVANTENIGMAAPSRMMAGDSYSQPSISTSPDRMVEHNTNLSLQVKSVAETVKMMTEAVKNVGGFVISSNVNSPGEAASGTLSVRIPNDNVDQVLAEFKNSAIKVVSETVSGYDVTDQYEDTASRLATLMASKTKLEKMHTDAASVSELLEVQRELSNLQIQIDNLKGREQYLKEVSKLTLVSVHLATDDLALPYAPDTSWRPAVIFKQAVRSLVITLRSIGNAAIWVGVYAPFWVPVAIGLIVWKKRSVRA